MTVLRRLKHFKKRHNIVRECHNKTRWQVSSSHQAWSTVTARRGGAGHRREDVSQLLNKPPSVWEVWQRAPWHLILPATTVYRKHKPCRTQTLQWAAACSAVFLGRSRRHGGQIAAPGEQSLMVFYGSGSGGKLAMANLQCTRFGHLRWQAARRETC